MMVLRALWRALTDDLNAARAIQDALTIQRQDDLTEIVLCHDCGGLGAVADYTNRLEPIDGHPTYGGKRCLRCMGTGRNM